MSVQKPGLLIFANNSGSKQNKKNLTLPFVDIDKQKTCAMFQQKNIELQGSYSSSKFQTKYLVS